MNKYTCRHLWSCITVSHIFCRCACLLFLKHQWNASRGCFSSRPTFRFPRFRACGMSTAVQILSSFLHHWEKPFGSCYHFAAAFWSPRLYLSGSGTMPAQTVPCKNQSRRNIVVNGTIFVKSVGSCFGRANLQAICLPSRNGFGWPILTCQNNALPSTKKYADEEWCIICCWGLHDANWHTSDVFALLAVQDRKAEKYVFLAV